MIRARKDASLNLIAVAWCLITSAALSAATSDRVALSLTDLTGEFQNIESYSGRVVVLNFWATWCEPCREEMPMLSGLQERYADRGVVVVGASVDDDSTREQIEPFLDKQRISFPVWTGATAVDMQRFGLSTALPSTAIIDQEGQIAFRFVGLLKRKQLVRRLEYLLLGSRSKAPERFVDSVSDAPSRHENEGGGHEHQGDEDHAHGGIGMEGASLVPS